MIFAAFQLQDMTNLLKSSCELKIFFRKEFSVFKIVKKLMA